MKWMLSYRADPSGRVLADRHYNRQKVGAAQFVPPGACLVLLTEDLAALWITSAPKAEYVQHAWAGAWVCSVFRNERPAWKYPDGHVSSELVAQALAATRAELGEPPPIGMVTFIDEDKTRRKRDPGRCFRKAGFSLAHTGLLGPTLPRTQAGLVALQITGPEMPPARAPIGAQLGLVGHMKQPQEGNEQHAGQDEQGQPMGRRA
jgi:hypothetical protein